MNFYEVQFAVYRKKKKPHRTLKASKKYKVIEFLIRCQNYMEGNKNSLYKAQYQSHDIGYNEKIKNALVNGGKTKNKILN